MIISGILAYFTVEILHYVYLTYKINSIKFELIKDDNSKNKNFFEDETVNKYLKQSDYENKIEIENIYKYLSNTFKLDHSREITLITPNFLSIRLFYSGIFIYQLIYLKYLGFNYQFTNNSIIFEKKTNTEYLILFHTGMLGNLHHMIRFISMIDHKKYSIMIVIFRSNLSTLFWNNSDLNEHIQFLDIKISSYNNIIPISHSFGSLILESLYNYNGLITDKIQKEVLIQPGNIASMGIIFIGSQHLNYWSYVNFIRKYSKYHIYNMVFTYMIKSMAGLSTIYSVKNFSGIRLEPRKISGYLILSSDDPLVNPNEIHPFSDEIHHIFPNHKIFLNSGYHGISEDEEISVEKCLKEIVKS